MENEWLLDEIAEGMQKLFCLSLERTPAAEVIPGTAQGWVEALQHGRSWVQARDADRIAAAFVTMAATRRTWPAPIDLVEALPPPAAQPVLAHEVIAAAPDIVASVAQSLGYQLRADRKPDGKTAAAGPDA